MTSRSKTSGSEAIAELTLGDTYHEREQKRIALLRDWVEHGSTEEAHIEADEMLLDACKELGASSEFIEAFRALPKYYV